FVTASEGTLHWDYHQWIGGAFTKIASFDRGEVISEAQFVDLFNTGLPARFMRQGSTWRVHSAIPVMHDLLITTVVGADKLDRKTRFFYVPMSNRNFYEAEPY